MKLGVLCIRRYELLDDFVASVMEGSRHPEKIVLIDNGGQYAANHPDVEVLYQGANLGVAASWNKLLRAGVWIISNDDVTFGRDTFTEMAAALESGELFVNAGGWALFGQRPELAERIGFYDERFFPAYYEDTDYLVRMTEAGISVRSDVLSEPLQHVQWASAESVPQVNGICQKSYATFVEKWGGHPDEVLSRVRSEREAKV